MLNSELEKIIKRIEELREQLVKLGQYKNINDEEMLEASRRLDEELNNYHRLLLKIKK